MSRAKSGLASKDWNFPAHLTFYLSNWQFDTSEKRRLLWCVLLRGCRHDFERESSCSTVIPCRYFQ